MTRWPIEFDQPKQRRKMPMRRALLYIFIYFGVASVLWSLFWWWAAGLF